MHQSALNYGRLFFETYAPLFDEGMVIDIGAQNVNGSLKDVCPPSLEYCGVDFVAGNGVDVILTDPYKLPFENESADIIVSSSCFEHSEFFWLIYLEIMRVLKPNGIFYLNVPSNGYVHRYPVDCWRFYPDSGRALVSWAEMNGFTPALLESFVGNQSGGIAEGEAWNDFVAVFVKDRTNEKFYNDRIVNKISHYTNGILSSKEFLNPSFYSEDESLIIRYKNDITRLSQAVTERDRHIAQLQHSLDIMRQSTRRRITASLRWPMLQWQRVKRIIRLAPWAVRQGGDIKSTITKALSLYRCEGLAGIRRGILLVQKVSLNDYAEWVRRYDTLSDETRATMRTRIDAYPRKPLISVLMPTYNPKSEWLIEAIESVRKQSYPYWELCIADDHSTDPVIRSLLKKFVKNDPRIKVVFREKNGHISAASNSALELATGDWVALMDHYDLLPEHALYWVADAINRNPDARLIYSDEDKIDEQGKRHTPYFKCDWNPDLFFSQNMFCHLGVYERQLIEDVNGFRLGLEGAQDYDLALRCIEKVNSNQIYHIPRVLYHGRVHDKSTVHSADAKPYAKLAGKRALNEHFNRTDIDASVVATEYGYRVQYSLPEKMPLVSLIIPTRNGLELIHQSIGSILEKTIYPNYEILIIDNGSDEPEVLDYLESLSSESRVQIHRDDRPFNYSQLNNSAVELAKGSVIGLLNNDIEVISPEWLSEMVSHALRPEVGAVGAKLWYANGTLQHGGVVLGIGGGAGHSHKHFSKGRSGYFNRLNLISGYSAVTAACLVVEKSIYKQVDGLNEHDLKIAYNDVDFCLRVREAGYRNIWTPYAELYHYESASRGFDDTPEKQARVSAEVEYMHENWGEVFESDPAYSPNLTLEYEDFSYAWPPRIDMQP